MITVVANFSAKEAFLVSSQIDREKKYFEEILLHVISAAERGLFVAEIPYDYKQIPFPTEKLEGLGYVVEKTPNGIFPHLVKWGHVGNDKKEE